MIKKIKQILSGLPAVMVAGLALLLSMILHLTQQEIFFDPAYLVLLICLPPILDGAIYYARQAKLTSAMLISLAVIAAVVIGEVIAAAEVVFIIALGEILEEMMVARLQKHLLGLHHLYPQTAHLLKKDGEQPHCLDCPVARLKLNDLVRIFPGEMIAVDGVIVAGKTSVNQAILTGESLPVDKGVGQQVLAGTQNQFGTIDVQVNKVGQQVFIQQMITLVKKVKQSKIPLQQTIDSLATILLPLALLGAILTWLIGSISGAGFLLALKRGIAVLVVFCPCALALATPVTMMAAIAAAVKQGILIKSSAALEYFSRLHALAFDKTGTLTTAALQVVSWQSFSAHLSKAQLLALAASVQAHSEHPLGKAIVRQAVTAKLPLQTVANFQVLPGQGVKAKLANQQVILCGSESLFKQQHIKLSSQVQALLRQCYRQGQSVVLVAIDHRVVGLLSCADACRPEANLVLAKLRQYGLQLLLFSGDNPGAVATLAKKLGIDNYYSKLLPRQKANLVRQLQKQGKYVGMVGDGINDALALQEASVGIAMLQVGNDLALNAAEVVILNGNLCNLIYLRRLAQAALRLIKWDIGLSLVVNLGAIIFAALGFLPPVYGALFHNVGSVIVVGNALLFYFLSTFGAGKLLGLLYNNDTFCKRSHYVKTST